MTSTTWRRSTTRTTAYKCVSPLEISANPILEVTNVSLKILSVMLKATYVYTVSRLKYSFRASFPHFLNLVHFPEILNSICLTLEALVVCILSHVKIRFRLRMFVTRHSYYKNKRVHNNSDPFARIWHLIKLLLVTMVTKIDVRFPFRSQTSDF
jgi:hypothetical protein